MTGPAGEWRELTPDRTPPPRFPAGPGRFRAAARHAVQIFAILLIVATVVQIAAVWFLGWKLSAWTITGMSLIVTAWAFDRLEESRQQGREATAIDRIGSGIVDYLEKHDDGGWDR